MIAVNCYFQFTAKTNIHISLISVSIIATENEQYESVSHLKVVYFGLNKLMSLLIWNFFHGFGLLSHNENSKQTKTCHKKTGENIQSV